MDRDTHQLSRAIALPADRVPVLLHQVELTANDRIDDAVMAVGAGS
ncbi:hypothetical protein ACIHCQ_21595 [Streptomyces sp. NPDC052236]